MGGWLRWALLSPDRVAPSQMVGVSASVSLPFHHKVQKFSSGTGSPEWSRKRAVKQLCGGGGSGVYFSFYSIYLCRCVQKFSLANVLVLL